MKILFISNIFPPHVRGGYELGCLEIAEKYQELGHSIIVATSENTPELRKYPEPTHINIQRIFSPLKYYEDLHDYHFQSNSIYYYEKIMAFGGYIEGNCIALKRLIELQQPDLIWIFNPLGIGPIGIFDTVVSCGIKVIIHLMDHIDGVVQDYSRAVNLIGKWQYLKTKIAAISCSNKIYESNNLLGKYYFNRLIYNWVDIKKNLDISEHLISLESKKCAPHDKFRILYFGQIAEKKGIGLLYNLAKVINNSPYRDKITIELYGKGETVFIDLLEKQVVEDKLSEIFIFKGFLSKQSLLRKISEYNLAVFLLSDDEPFGYAPIEAMLREVPVIITSKTGVSEILKDKHDAIFVKDRKDINELYEKIVWCLQNPTMLETIRKNALITIKQKCDLDTVTVPALNEIIEDIVVNTGYSFDYVLAACETLKYPFVELNTNTNLKGARYKFIDTVITRLYNLPLIGESVERKIKNFVYNYRTYR